MLLPAAGAKGFGLAFMIDLLCGLLSGGSYCEGLASMFSAPKHPADCSWLLIASIDPAHFGLSQDFTVAVAAAAEKLRDGKRQDGSSTGCSRPEIASAWPKNSAGGMIALAPAVVLAAQPYRIQSGY